MEGAGRVAPSEDTSMEERTPDEAARETNRILSALAEVHTGLAAIQKERRRLVEDVQGHRGEARHSRMRVEDERRRLVARRSRASQGEIDEAKLQSLAAAIDNEQAALLKEVAEYGTALHTLADARARLRRQAQDLEKRRSELARGLPRVFARAYGDLLAQGIADPIVDLHGREGCVCGRRLDRSREVFPTTCESCDRLMILGEAASSGGEAPAR